MKSLTLSNKETVEVQDGHHEYLAQYTWHRAADGTIYTTIRRPNGRQERLSIDFVIDRDLRELTGAETADQQRMQYGEWLGSSQAAVIRHLAEGMFETYMETLAGTLKNNLNLSRREAIIMATTATAMAMESLEDAIDGGEFDEALDEALHEQGYTQEQIEEMHRKSLHS